MKKTLLITLEYPPMIGGVSHYYKNLVANLPQDKIVVLDNAHSQLLFGMLWPKWIKGVWTAYRLIKKEHIKHLLVGQILPIGTIALILKKILGIEYTVMTHAMDITLPFGETGSKRKQKLVKKILGCAENVTTVSNYTKKQLLDIGVPEEKIHLVYPCPHVEQESSIRSEELDEKYDLKEKTVVLSVCRLVERKGVDMSIRAMKHVVKKHPDSVLVIVGEGKDKERLEQIVKEEKMDAFVRFTGRSTPDELAAWYQRATLLVMPSRQMSNRDVEGFGIVFIEAGVFAKPVIGGNSGGIPDAIEDGKTGFLVDPLDASAIAEKILQLIEHPALAEELGKNGQERVQKEFQWETQAKKVEQLLS